MLENKINKVLVDSINFIISDNSLNTIKDKINSAIIKLMNIKWEKIES